MFIFRKIILFTMLFVIPSLLFSNTSEITNTPNENSLAILYTIPGNIEKKYNTLVEEKIKSINFHLTDPHKRVNDHYKTEFGSTVLDILSFMPVVNDKVILPLLNINPQIAGFAPFNLLIEKKLDDKNTHVGHLMPKVMLDILHIKNKEIREKFTASVKSLDALIAKELGGKVSYIKMHKLPKQTMMKFEYSFDIPDDIEDFLDEFQEKFEAKLTEKKYLVAGYHNFMDGIKGAKEILKKYDAFWSYSLCHMEFSYNVFDKKGARPEAGLFAPCTMYMYIPKDSGKLIIGMYRLHNWSDSLGIEDKTRVSLIEKLDKEIPEMLTSMGAKDLINKNSQKTKETVPSKNKTAPIQKSTTEKSNKIQKIKNGDDVIEIIIPKPPKVPTPVKLITKNSGGTDMRSIKFSKRVPPNYIDHSKSTQKERPKNTSDHIGEVKNSRISAYIRAKYIDIKDAQALLKKAGFNIISVAPVDKKGKLTSIVFTSKSLTSMASKKNRGFMASLRLLVNKKNNHISITNPLYLAKAFMQEDFDEKIPKETLKKLTSNFKNMLNSKDMLKFQLLPKYQFMHGMPQYQDMTTVATGKDLLKKAKKHKRVVFIQKLDNGSTLIGIKLRKRTNKFINKIGTNNAALLPYPVLIENGKAKILDPKYYISVMYPLLQMSEFMTIATIPGAIVNDCERIFQ